MRRLWILLLVLTLAGCRMEPAFKPDVIVDIPLNPTEAATRAVTEPETVPPVTEPEPEPVTETEAPGPQPAEPTAPPPTQPNPVKSTRVADRIAEDVNTHRQSAGLEPLALDAGLCAAADTRTRELLTLMSHTRPDSTGWETALGSHGYGFTAEIVHYGSSAGIVDRWMNIDAHRQKLLSEAPASMGAAAYTFDGVTYAVIILAG